MSLKSHDNLKTFALRAPDELLEKLEQLAEQQNRSINAEIITILKHVINALHDPELKDAANKFI